MPVLPVFSPFATARLRSTEKLERGQSEQGFREGCYAARRTAFFESLAKVAHDDDRRRARREQERERQARENGERLDDRLERVAVGPDADRLVDEVDAAGEQTKEEGKLSSTGREGQSTSGSPGQTKLTMPDRSSRLAEIQPRASKSSDDGRATIVT
jgi:hypothetical protein